MKIMNNFNYIENMIIRETARLNDRENKLISLEYIRISLSRERNNIYTVFDTLQYLAFEGTVNATSQNNIINNFPDVRLEAIKILGQFNIIQTRRVLMEVLKYENNSLVLQETLKLLFSNWSDFYSNNDEINIIINAIEKINILN